MSYYAIHVSKNKIVRGVSNKIIHDIRFKPIGDTQQILNKKRPGFTIESTFESINVFAPSGQKILIIKEY